MWAHRTDNASKRVMGIEPTPSAWKAEVLPLNYTRISVEGAGFEPAKAEPSDLQSDPFDRSGTPPLTLPAKPVFSPITNQMSTQNNKYFVKIRNMRNSPRTPFTQPYLAGVASHFILAYGFFGSDLTTSAAALPPVKSSTASLNLSSPLSTSASTLLAITFSLLLVMSSTGC